LGDHSERTYGSNWADCGPSFEALGAKEKGQESGTSVSGEQIAYEFIRPGSGAADVQPVTLAVACAMTFRSWPATHCDPKSLLPAAKASDIKYADLDQSMPYSRLTLKYIGQFYARFSLYIRCLGGI
jgi:hypothetical protein